MKIKAIRFIPYLMVLLPFVFLVGMSFFLSSYYSKKVTKYLNEEKEKVLNDYIDLKKVQNEEKMHQMITLVERKNSAIESEIKEELKLKVNIAYDIAHEIDAKYKKKKKLAKQRVKDALYELVSDNEYDTLFITDYRANAILLGSHLEEKNIAQYLDKDSRSIVYEEIQKVRRHGEGFITSVRNSGNKEIIYVKNLNLYNWYIGSNILIKDKRTKVKSKLLEMIENMPIEQFTFVGIYSNGEKIYHSNDTKIRIHKVDENCKWQKNQAKDYYFYTCYMKAFEWTIVYGFNTTSMRESVQKKYNKLKQRLHKEVELFTKVAGGSILLIMIFALFFALKINKVLKNRS